MHIKVKKMLSKKPTPLLKKRIEITKTNKLKEKEQALIGRL